MPICHCGKNAIYNMIGEKKGSFCKKHRLPGMLNVVSKEPSEVFNLAIYDAFVVPEL